MGWSGRTDKLRRAVVAVEVGEHPTAAVVAAEVGVHSTAAAAAVVLEHSNHHHHQQSKAELPHPTPHQLPNCIVMSAAAVHPTTATMAVVPLGPP